MQTAVFAGGCFWCLEAVFTQLQGVIAVKNGYIAGNTANPSYEDVCTGRTGHAEAVKIDFDETTITYEQLLHVFFTIHDPTTLNRQGNDVGTQYRSGIYYLTAEQQQLAQATVEALQPHFPHPIMTEIQAAGEFYPAEIEHDDYYATHPNQGYCQWVIAPKVGKAQSVFAKLWKTQ